MKKIISLVMVIAMIAALAVTTSAVEISTDGLIGLFTFDEGNLVNSVDGTEGTPYSAGSGFGEALYDIDDPDRYWMTQGVSGYAFYCGDADGFGTNVNPGDSDFTVGFWLTVPSKEAGYVPYMWYGEQAQGSGYYSSERWIGVWNVDTNNLFGEGTWAVSYGPFVGSNDNNGARIQVEPEESLYDADGDYLLQWTHVVVSAVQVKGETEDDLDTYTVTLYLNGEPVNTVEGLPDPYTGDPETYGDYIYFNGVNAWGDHPSVGAIDEVVIYNRALSDADVSALYSAYSPATFTSAEDFDAAVASIADVTPDTEAPADDTTAAPAEDTEAPADDTNAPSEENTTAAPEEEKSGCGSSMGAAAIVALVATLGCAVVKKH